MCRGASSGGVTTYHLFGSAIDEPLASSSGSAVVYPSVDGLGSVALSSDVTGAVQNTYSYDAWGVSRSSTESFSQPFRYTARERPDAADQLFYRARFFAPSIGRFLNEDPIGFAGSFTNYYRYTNNDPISYIDPTGLATIFNFSKCCVLTSDNDKTPNQKKRYIPPGGTSLSFDADAIYFGDGSALKIPDGSVWIIYDCNALKKWNGSKPLLNGIGPYKVKSLPTGKDQEKEFGPILPPDPCKKCPS